MTTITKVSGQMTKTKSANRIPSLAGLILAVLMSLVGTGFAQDASTGEHGPIRVAVTGRFDFSIVPENLPPYLTSGTDGDLYLRDMPAVGKFALAGRQVAIDAKFSAQVNGEFDATGTGVIWGTAIMTTTVDGRKTIIFDGEYTGNTVELVAAGRVSLKGRGPYADTR